MNLLHTKSECARKSHGIIININIITTTTYHPPSIMVNPRDGRKGKGAEPSGIQNR
jgi:hypothetical protein